MRINNYICKKHNEIFYLGDALSYRASPLPKQSTGLFGNSPLAERLNASQSFALHGTLSHTLQETLSLDSAKGFHPLESHYSNLTTLTSYRLNLKLSVPPNENTISESAAVTGDSNSAS